MSGGAFEPRPGAESSHGLVPGRRRAAGTGGCGGWRHPRGWASVNSGQLALEYGFTDLDGSQPDVWRYIEEIRENDLEADFADYR